MQVAPLPTSTIEHFKYYAQTVHSDEGHILMNNLLFTVWRGLKNKMHHDTAR